MRRRSCRRSARPSGNSTRPCRWETSPHWRLSSTAHSPAPADRPGLIGVFAGISVLLAAIGLWGVVAELVAQQRREIGIRMALGARSRDVLSQVLRNALGLVG